MLQGCSSLGNSPRFQNCITYDRKELSHGRTRRRPAPRGALAGGTTVLLPLHAHRTPLGAERSPREMSYTPRHQTCSWFATRADRGHRGSTGAAGLPSHKAGFGAGSLEAPRPRCDIALPLLSRTPAAKFRGGFRKERESASPS